MEENTKASHNLSKPLSWPRQTGIGPSRNTANKLTWCPQVIIIIFLENIGSISPHHKDASGHASLCWGVADYRVSLKMVGGKHARSGEEGSPWAGGIAGCEAARSSSSSLRLSRPPRLG